MGEAECAESAAVQPGTGAEDQAPSHYKCFEVSTSHASCMSATVIVAERRGSCRLQQTVMLIEALKLYLPRFSNVHVWQIDT